MERPTPEEIEAAREWLRQCIAFYGTLPDARQHAANLLAATEPLTEEQVCGMVAEYYQAHLPNNILAAMASRQLEKLRSHDVTQPVAIVAWFVRKLFGQVKS